MRERTDRAAAADRRRRRAGAAPPNIQTSPTDITSAVFRVRAGSQSRGFTGLLRACVTRDPRRSYRPRRREPAATSGESASLLRRREQ